jgi:hypothetical protein
VPDETELRGALVQLLREIGGPIADGVEVDDPSALLTALTSLIEARDLVDALHQIEAAR